MQVLGKIERTGLRIEEIGQHIRSMASDGVIDNAELRQLLISAQELTSCADAVEDLSLDIQIAARVMKHGRDRAVNPHLKCRIFDLAAVREARQKETASQASTPDDAA